MDVTLPNGIVIEGIPDDTPKEVVMEKAISAGYATKEDFPDFEPTSELDEVGVGDKFISAFTNAPAGAVGLVEAAGEMTTGLMSAGLGAVAGSGAALTAAFDDEEATKPGEAYSEVFEAFSQKGTYHPRTHYGKLASETIAAPFVWMSGKSEEAADEVFEITGSPELATATRITGEAVSMASPFIAGKGLKYAGNKVKERVNKRINKKEKPPQDDVKPIGQDVKSIDRYDQHGYTPLMRAVQSKDIESVSLLLSKGANRNIKDGNLGTSTALSMAQLLHKRSKTIEDKKSYKKIIDMLKSEEGMKPPKTKSSGTKNLDPRILTEEEFIEAYRVQYGSKDGKKKVDVPHYEQGIATTKKVTVDELAKSEYPEYRRSARERIEKEYQIAMDEVLNGSVGVKGNIQVRQMSIDELTGPGWADAPKRSPQKATAPESGLEGASVGRPKLQTKKEQIAEAYNKKNQLELSEQEALKAAAWEQAELRAIENFELQRARDRAQKGNTLIEEQIDNSVRLGAGETGYSSRQSGRKHWGKQAGELDPQVYMEGLIKAGESLKSITRKMRKEFGDHWELLTPHIYAKIKTTMDAAEAAPKESIVDVVGPMVKGEKKGIFVPERIKSRFKGTGALASFIEVVAGKSITMLRKKAETNPHLKSIVDMIERPEKVPPGVVVADDLTTAYFKRAGGYLKKLSDIMDMSGDKWFTGVRETFRGKLKKPLNESIVSLLRQEKIEGDSIAHNMARELRGMLDEVHQYAKAAGLEPAYLKGYFPRMFKIKDLRKNKELMAEFEAVLAKHGMDKVEIGTLVKRLINEDGVLSVDINKSGRQGIYENGQYKSPKKAVSVDLTRKLKHIPDSELAPFLNNNVYDVLVKYIEDVAARAEFAKRFGANEGKLNKAIAEAIKYGYETGNPITSLELYRLYDLIDASQRSWVKIKNPTWRTASNVAVTGMNLMTLPLASASALIEMGLPMYGGGIRAYAKAWPKAVSTEIRQLSRKIYKGIPKSVAHQTAESILKASDLAATERVTALFNGEVNAVNTAFFKGNLLHGVTKFTQILAQETLTNLMMDFAKKSGQNGTWSGKLPWRKKEHARIEQFMNRLGVNKVDLIDWYNRGMPRAGDKFYEGQYKTAVLNFIHENVMSSRAAVRPMWHSIPHLAVFAHLKGFPTMFGNTVLKRWYLDTVGELRQGNLYTGTKNTAQIVGTGALMLMLADLGTQLSDLARYGETNPKYAGDDTARLRRAADRAGFFPPGGWSIIGNSIRAKELWGGEPIIAMAGPTASKLNDVAKGVGMIHKTSKPLANTLAGMTPGANVNREVRKQLAEEYQEWLDSVTGR